MPDPAPVPPSAAAAPVARLIRAAVTWALATSATTAFVGAVARALCLPPYWPAGFALRCRPDGIVLALFGAFGDAGVTTLLLAVPALAAGAAVHLVARGAARLRPGRPARIVAAALAAGVWIVLARALEPGYLDFILGGYAIGAGAAVGALIGAALAGRDGSAATAPGGGPRRRRVDRR